MKILIIDTNDGRLVSMTIGENETFRDLYERMESERGMQMNFDNLKHDDSIDLDENISSYLSDSNPPEESDVVTKDIKCEIFGGINNEETNTVVSQIETVDVKPPDNMLDKKYGIQRCRLCASENLNMIDIFERDETCDNIIEKIISCLPIVVRENDSLPKQACIPCLEKLEYSHQFYRTVKEAEKQFATLAKEVSEEFWKLDKHYRTSLLQKEQFRSKEYHRENFSCADCRKSFARKWDLVIHIRSHTGERPFGCDFCHKSYKTQAQRNNHRRTHTDERPFKCTTCEKTFAQASRLSEHAKVHTVIRPYKCSFCEKSFKRIHARTIHMTTHTGQKLYQCDVCAKNFRWPGAMRRHKKDQHRMK